MTTKSDWDRVRALTDKEAEENAKNDPDAQPTSKEFWAEGTLVYPVIPPSY